MNDYGVVTPAQAEFSNRLHHASVVGGAQPEGTPSLPSHLDDVAAFENIHSDAVCAGWLQGELEGYVWQWVRRMLRRKVKIVRNLNSVPNRQWFCSMRTRIQKRWKVRRRRRRVELLFAVFDGWLLRPRQREVMMTMMMRQRRSKVDVVQSHVHSSLLMGGSYVGFRSSGWFLQSG